MAHACDGVGLGDRGRVEGALGVAGTYPCVWKDSTLLKMNNHPLMGSSEGRIASGPPAGASHDCDGFTSQEGRPPPLPRERQGQVEGTTQMRHFDGYPYAAKGLQFPRCVTEALDQLVSNDSLITLTCVSENDSVACLTGSCLPGDAPPNLHKPCANWSEQGL